MFGTSDNLQQNTDSSKFVAFMIEYYSEVFVFSLFFFFSCNREIPTQKNDRFLGPLKKKDWR